MCHWSVCWSCRVPSVSRVSSESCAELGAAVAVGSRFSGELELELELHRRSAGSTTAMHSRSEASEEECARCASRLLWWSFLPFACTSVCPSTDQARERGQLACWFLRAATSRRRCTHRADDTEGTHTQRESGKGTMHEFGDWGPTQLCTADNCLGWRMLRRKHPRSVHLSKAQCPEDACRQCQCRRHTRTGCTHQSFVLCNLNPL